MRVRLVSEIVAVILLLLIVAVVGFTIYLAFLSQMIGMSRAVESATEKAEESLVSLKIVDAIIYVDESYDDRPCGYIELLLTASVKPVRLTGVYIGNYPIYPNATAFGVKYVGCDGITLPNTTLYVLPGESNYTVLPLTDQALAYILGNATLGLVQVKVVGETALGTQVSSVYSALVVRLS